MSPISWIRTRAWIAVLIVAMAASIGANARRWQRVEHVSALTEPTPQIDAQSPSGYAGGIRHLLVPEHNAGSYQWIAQTQQMLTRHEWRVRHVSYDNTPYGREVRSASLYRWWLGAVAAVDRAWTGRPTPAVVEHAALFSNPLLHVLVLLGVTLFVALHFGGWAAGLTAAALAIGFPLAGAYVPGQPDDQALWLGGILASLLPLLVGVARPPGRRWLAVAGVAGGLTLWADVSIGVPLVVGVALGALADAWQARRRVAERAPIAWRVWALSGAGTVLLAFLLDTYPGPGGWGTLDAVHPLYGLAWLGLGELIEAVAGRSRPGTGPRRRRDLVRWLGGAAAVAMVPAVMYAQHSRGFLSANLLSDRLTALPHSPIASSLFEWMMRDGIQLAWIGAVAPLVLLIPAGWILFKAPADDARRSRIALACGPVLVALGYATVQLRWWAAVDAALIVLLVALAAGGGPISRARRAAWLAAFAGVLSFSAGLMWPRASSSAAEGVSSSEVESLVERDLAHWLAARTGPRRAAVLAPPELAASLAYYGGVGVLSTPYRENVDGFAAAVRIAGAGQPDEAHALVRRRELTHIVVPSWDNYLDEYARLGATKPDKSLLNLLHQWLPPRWLRAIPYQMPAIPGFEGRSVVVFEVVEVQDDATGLSHLAEYFVEMGDLDNAAKVSDALAHLYPEDPGALLARCVVERARGNAAGLSRTLKSLLPLTAGAGADSLAWERRIVLAIVLAEAQRFDAARIQLRRGFDEMDEPRLRSLTTGTLFRMQALAHVLGLSMADPRMRQLAHELLPLELREQLAARAPAPAAP